MAARFAQRETDRLYDSTHAGAISNALGFPRDPFGADLNWGDRPLNAPRGSPAARHLRAAWPLLKRAADHPKFREAMRRRGNWADAWAHEQGNRVFNWVMDKLPFHTTAADRNAMWDAFYGYARGYAMDNAGRIYDPLAEWLTGRA